MAGRPEREHAVPAGHEGRLRARVLALIALASLATTGGVATAIGCGITADYSGLQGGLVADAAVPDAGAPETGLLGFCASQPTPPKLCADFDEGQPVDTGWTSRDQSANATVAVDSNGYSPPGAMLSTLTPDDVPGSARLKQSVPVLANHVHLEWKMLLPTGGGPFELVAVHQSSPVDGRDYGFFYKQEAGDLLVYVGSLHTDGGISQYVYALGKPPANWLHVEVDFVIGVHGSLVVKHDGSTVINEPDMQSATDDRSQVFVDVGFYSPDGATAHADFDDVIVDWQ